MLSGADGRRRTAHELKLRRPVWRGRMGTKLRRFCDGQKYRYAFF